MTEVFIALGVSVVGSAIGGAIGTVVAHYIIKRWF